MRLIWRDAWFWRGGFADHEIAYTPVLADATSGPIDAPALEHWPVLSTPAEAAWAVHRVEPGLGMDALVAVGAAHMALVARTGGYHAVLPPDCPDVRELFGTYRAGATDPVCFDEALALLDRAGVVDHRPEGLALLRAPATPARDLPTLRAALDARDLEASDDPAHRATADAWLRQASGLRRRRYRELAAFGRLTATVALDPPPADDPTGELAVGRTTLPPVRGGDMVEREHLHPARSLLSLRSLTFDRADADGTPLLTADYEIAALLLVGRGATAMRRVSRATCLWLLLAEASGGMVGHVDRSLRSLARDAAAVCGLAEGTDFRHQARTLLGDLERAGAVSREDDGTIRVLRPPGPTDEAVRETLAELIAWRATSEDPLHGAALPTEHLERRVRDMWVRLLEEGRVTMTVRPATVEALDAHSRVAVA
ncbi:hypothetical protein [Patulibacter minatonensis]|uniref:hypothetical protein n=1 Tax=Patulibacter minatonensis TaxID=298163 RepID=UPI00047EBBD6|nr:hypothetical protein [Patulibacter minatonensis]